MGFAGLKKPDERANLIAFLRTLADTPAPLPEAAGASRRACVGSRSRCARRGSLPTPPRPRNAAPAEAAPAEPAPAEPAPAQ